MDPRILLRAVMDRRLTPEISSQAEIIWTSDGKHFSSAIASSLREAKIVANSLIKAAEKDTFVTAMSSIGRIVFLGAYKKGIAMATLGLYIGDEDNPYEAWLVTKNDRSSSLFPRFQDALPAFYSILDSADAVKKTKRKKAGDTKSSKAKK